MVKCSYNIFIKKNKETMLRRLLISITILLTVILSIQTNYAQNSSNLSIYKVVRFLQYVSSDYVDTIDVEIGRAHV